MQTTTTTPSGHTRCITVLPASTYLFLATLCLLTGCLIGCSKDAPAPKDLYDLSKDIYFTINVAGKSYTSYGYHRKDPVYPQYGDGQTVIPYSIRGALGQDSMGLEFKISSKTFTGNQSVGNCNVHFFLKKPGPDTVGVYRELWQFQNKSGYFIDDGPTGYLLDSTGLDFHVSYADFGQIGGPRAIGYFTCKLYKENSPERFTATGAFRLARPF